MPVYAFEDRHPQVDPRAWIAPTAVVIGDVVLGPYASVWFGCVVRADMHYIRIGAYTNLQDNVVVHITKDTHPTVIGDHVTVGHRAIIHGCQVGDGCLIGMGAVIMDGAEVGAESLVAAGAVVTPGTQIPPRSLVRGVPARVIRELTEAEVAAIRANTELYVEYMKRYQAQEIFRS